MATVKTWEDEIGRMSKCDAEKKLEALKEMLSWSIFRENYNELRTIKRILHYHIESFQ